MNLRIALKAVKTQAYEALFKPHLESACTVWDPHTQVNVRRIDCVQRRAACYVCNRWHNTSSVSAMLNELSWESLARQRERARLCMMYKVVHGLVDIPWLQNKVLIPTPPPPSAQEDLPLGNLHPSSLTVIRSNFHLFHAQFLHGMLYPQ